MWLSENDTETVTYCEWVILYLPKMNVSSRGGVVLSLVLSFEWCTANKTMKSEIWHQLWTALHDRELYKVDKLSFTVHKEVAYELGLVY